MEVVIAMAMLGAALAFSTYSTDLIGTNYSINRRMTKAHDVASYVMEELLSVYESDAKLVEGNHAQGYDDNGRKVAASPIFSATWTVRHDFPITKVMEIKVTVSWSDNGHQRAVRYLTYRKT